MAQQGRGQQLREAAKVRGPEPAGLRDTLRSLPIRECLPLPIQLDDLCQFKVLFLNGLCAFVTTKDQHAIKKKRLAILIQNSLHLLLLQVHGILLSRLLL